MIEYDGVNDTLQVNSTASINNIATKTIGAWIYPITWGEVAGVSAGRIFDKRESVTGFFFGIDSSNRSLVFFHDFSTTDGTWKTATASMNTGQWFHVAVKYTRGSTANTPTFWINGSLQTTTTTTQPGGAVSTDATANLLLGANTSATNTFRGYHSEYVFYSVGLDNAEVALLASSVKGMPYQVRPSSLAMYLDTNDGVEGAVVSGANSVRDRSGNNNHGSPFPGKAPIRRAEQALSYP